MQVSKTTRTTSNVLRTKVKILRRASSSGVPTTRFAPVRLLLWVYFESICIDRDTSRRMGELHALLLNLGLE